MSRYEIFRECFPTYVLTEEMFNSLLRIEEAQCVEKYIDQKLVGFGLARNNAIIMLCVLPEFQKKGIGTAILQELEANIVDNNHERILACGFDTGLFIGVPSESRGFFEKNSFVRIDDCDEMDIDVQGFKLDSYSFRDNPEVSYGWFDGDIKKLHAAVEDVDTTWPQYFTKPEQVFCGFYKGEVACFCIVDYECECMLSGPGRKVGVIGCVGTVHKYRNMGIALKMVALATDDLKKQGCTNCFIHFTHVADWYAKIGYKKYLTQVFMEKKIR